MSECACFSLPFLFVLPYVAPACLLCLHVVRRARAQEIAVLEYQNKQKEETQTLAAQVQAAYDKGYDKAVETIQRFQNLRPAGPPPSACSGAPYSG